MTAWVAAGLASTVAAITWRALAVRTESAVRAAHELRGPLTAARLGLSGPGVALEPARVAAIELELARAALALDDLACPARFGHRPVARTVAAVDLCELLACAVEAERGLARSRGASVSESWSGAPASVLGDRVRLAQALGNLIANAIEHGGGQVSVAGSCVGTVARIEVVDGGPGLPAPIASLTRRARAGRGRRGRGLAIASEIVEAHGGRLATAPSESGARILLELPALREGWAGA